MILLLARIIFGASLFVGFIAAVYAAGENSKRAAYSRQLAVQRAENQRLQDTAVKLAASNAELRADDDLVYMQGFADGQAFERQMLPEPSLN